MLVSTHWRGDFLYDEPRFLLLQELRDPRRYFSILEAIAAGRTRQNEIAQATGIAPSSIAFYHHASRTRAGGASRARHGKAPS